MRFRGMMRLLGPTDYKFWINTIKGEENMLGMDLWGNTLNPSG